MRYLGIDYGTKNLGIALSDTGGSFAFPKDTISNNERVFDLLRRIVALEEVVEVIVGDTRSISGVANQVTAQADSFVEELEKSVGVPVKRVREAWSSHEAARFAPPGKKHDDSAAAAIILQRFLDSRQNNK